MTGLNRDAAREVLLKATDLAKSEWWREQLLDALEACVRPAPQQTIDRDALLKALAEFPYLGRADDVLRLADVVLALLRPVDGIVLTADEAGLAADGLRALQREGQHMRVYRDSARREYDEAERLAFRLEAAL